MSLRETPVMVISFSLLIRKGMAVSSGNSPRLPIGLEVLLSALAEAPVNLADLDVG